MKSFTQYISEATKETMKWNRYVMKTIDGKVADWIEVAFESDNKRFIIKKHKHNSNYELFDRRHPKEWTAIRFKSLEDAKEEAEWSLRNDPRTEWHPSLREGSYDFKDFKDPWAVMSPEDRKEANRLFKAAMKAFPSSPKQKELRAKLNAILKKYKIGEDWSKEYKQSINCNNPKGFSQRAHCQGRKKR
jgi:hypothetical protein